MCGCMYESLSQAQSDMYLETVYVYLYAICHHNSDKGGEQMIWNDNGFIWLLDARCGFGEIDIGCVTLASDNSFSFPFFLIHE